MNNEFSVKRQSARQPTLVKKNASPAPWTGDRRMIIGFCLGLFLLTLCVFYPITGDAFLNYDDNDYVTDNYHVQSGLVWPQIAWAFANTDVANWHPLTWLSHMLDCQLYGSNPWGHHLTSVLIHAANVALLFMVLRSLTAALGPSLFAALLFGLHPLRVESVAWIAERKDVLSTMFWLLTVWSYAAYVKSRKPVNYWLMLACFVLGLMSKPMVVTLPFALLLLDYWPLARMGRERLGRLVWEKMPLFVLAAAGSVVTFLAQKSQGAVIEYLPLSYRLETAVLAYIRYLGKFLYPANLAILYPHPKSWSILAVLAAAALFIGISIAVFMSRRSRPCIVAGWLWYVGTLVPVIGIIQIGSQSMADRYTYIPGLGLILILTWAARDAARAFFFNRFILPSAAAGILVACTVLTRHQIAFWKDSGTIFSHAVAVTDNAFIARKALADFYTSQGRTDEAMALYREALEMYPNYEGAHLNLGAAFNLTGHPKEAAGEFARAIQLQPDDASAYNDLGAVLGNGRIDESISLFEKAIQINPRYVDAYMNLGQAMDRKGRWPKAIAQYEAALRLRPSPVAHYFIGLDLEKIGQKNEAIAQLTEAVREQPENAAARQALEQLRR